ncbi:MAG: hypothetical protein QXH37_07560 [Candidatus Bathyarchaeia archaeon]
MGRGRKRIENPFEGGLASRIYLAAFPRPISSYGVAKKVIPCSPAQNASGRILRVVERFPEYFSLTNERVARRKFRTLIRSKFEPLLSRLAETCQLDSEELNVLKSFENNFRKAFEIFLDLTLKRDRGYLTRSLNAFEELLNALCLMAYMARLCSHAQTEAKAFSFHMLSRTLPNVLEVSDISNSELISIAKKLSQTISQQTIAMLYTKLRKKVPPTYEMVFTMLEGLEKYYKHFERAP